MSVGSSLLHVRRCVQLASGFPFWANLFWHLSPPTVETTFDGGTLLQLLEKQNVSFETETVALPQDNNRTRLHLGLSFLLVLVAAILVAL